MLTEQVREIVNWQKHENYMQKKLQIEVKNAKKTWQSGSGLMNYLSH